MDLEHPELSVSQSINPVPHIQRQWMRIEDARHAWEAALPLAHLYVTLRSLGRLDGRFQAEWRSILDGDFLAWAMDATWRRDLEWPEILAAKGALLDLMDRRGMVYRIEGPDSIDSEEKTWLADMAEEVTPSWGDEDE